MTPDADRRALLRAVIKRPDDNHPRLVYDDWLDEYGEHGWATFLWD